MARKTPTPTTISEALRRAIKASGLSQSELSRRSGVDVAALSRFASRQRGLTLTALDRLANVLKLRLVSSARKGKAKSAAKVKQSTPMKRR